MALANGVFVDTVVQALKNAIALDVTATAKLAMFTNSVVPDFSQSAPAYGSSPWNANEVSGTGYTAGGVTLTGLAFAELGSDLGTSMLDFDNPSWSTATIPNARGFLVYYTGLSNRGLLVRTFGSDYSSIAGNFVINVHANGVWNSDLS